jgi:hypothetical protein
MLLSTLLLNVSLPSWLTPQAVQLIGAVVAAVAGYLGVTRQIRQNRKAMQAQTYVALVNTARAVHLSETMDRIRTLRFTGPTAYADFKRSPLDEQTQIRGVIDFFNDLQHLKKYEYLTQEQVVSLYHVSLLDCAERLLPWWVEGFRAENGKPYYYASFEELCKAAQDLEGTLARQLKAHARS